MIWCSSLCLGSVHPGYFLAAWFSVALAEMDWFKRKNTSSSVPTAPPKSSSPPPNVIAPDASAAGVGAEPTAEQRLLAFEMERKEAEGEYLRRLESLAQVVSEKSEETEQLNEKLHQQEEDMKVLIDKMVAQEKELETYKENQTEYKRRLEVLTDCLEDLARENMKLAAKGAPASMPLDYEEERMPTRQEVQIQKTKSEVAAETAAKSVPTKSGSRNSGPQDTATQYNMPTAKTPKKASEASSDSHALVHTSSSAPTSPTSAHTTSSSTSASTTAMTLDSTNSKDSEINNKDVPNRRYTSSPTGGLVLPSKSKSKSDVRDAKTPDVHKAHPSPSSSSTTSEMGTSTPSLSSSTGSKHKRVPSNENDFSGMASDPKSLMVVLKKYKAQADSLRRVRISFFASLLHSEPNHNSVSYTLFLEHILSNTTTGPHQREAEVREFATIDRPIRGESRPER